MPVPDRLGTVLRGVEVANMIDLRSDTVTKPSDEMRRCIANAEVGDAVIDVDPTLEKLERLTAEILGKPAAVFMPSGSMTNQVAIRQHCDRGSEFICEADAHVYHYEQAAFAQLSGLVAQTVAGDSGLLRAEHLHGMIRPENDHMVRTRLVCLENTHNRWGGRIHPQSQMDEICDWAHQNGLKTHLDGARLWNASVATQTSERDLAKNFDSISVCFSKGLGAPVGSALAGSEDFVCEARRTRKLFGGAMRQAGVLAAGALYALENNRDRLADDHAAAQLLGDAMRATSVMQIRGAGIDTNIVAAEIDSDWGTAEQFVSGLAKRDVSCFAIGPQVIRMVTHLDVTPAQIDEACKSIGAVAAGRPDASGN